MAGLAGGVFDAAVVEYPGRSWRIALISSPGIMISHKRPSLTNAVWVKMVVLKVCVNGLAAKSA